MKRLDHYWYSENAVSIALLPLSWLFCLISGLRRRLYRRGLKASHKLPVPVIVVGNISVGGTGKTPLVIWLAHYLSGQGYRPGIISRGYGGKAKVWPQAVDARSDPRQVGDEPVLLARRTGCPLWVGPDRPATGEALLAASDCDIILSDDGLQHYALERDIEIVVIDGERGLGNGHCLPAGPLRERASRLANADLVVSNGPSPLSPWQMRLEPGALVNLAASSMRVGLNYFQGQGVHAVAGIGNPERFFHTLQQLGIVLHRHPFPDHHPFSEADITPADALPVIMTEKDAVKCDRFSHRRHWFLEVSARLDKGFIQQLDRQLRELRYGQETA